MAAPQRDLSKAKIRSWIEASMLDAAAGQIHRQFGARKTEVIGAMSGTVVELGPGTGANLRYYGPGTRVIGIEPNTNLHAKLLAKAKEHGVDLEIRSLRGEQLDVESASVDGVVATLVLCGVDDPVAVVDEVKRVLRPGGQFFFVEHVAAPAGTVTRRIQTVVKRPHRWMFQGCEVDRDTASLLAGAGFSELELDEIEGSATDGYVRHRIVGTAVR